MKNDSVLDDSSIAKVAFSCIIFLKQFYYIN